MRFVTAKYRLPLAFLLTLTLSLITNTTKANSYNVYVGEPFSLPIPKSPVSNGFINSYAFSSSSSKVDVDPNTGFSTVTSYFDGTVRLECHYQYIYLVNGKYYKTASSYDYHMVSCRSNNITISSSKSTMNVGEQMSLSYRFDNESYRSRATVKWKSSSSAVSVSNNGVVTALSPGKATITATSNLGSNTASITIEVQKLDPTHVTITTSQNSVYCDEGLQLRATVYPSGASQSVTWEIPNNKSNTATLSSSGYLRGVSAGSVTVKATAENGVYTTKEFRVVEPQFSKSGTTPQPGETNQSVFIQPSVSFSHDLYTGTNYSSIALNNADKGDKIDGTVSISGKNIKFIPTKALLPQTNYILTIPANAVKNKWGTHYASNINLSFKTGNYEKLTLSTSNSNRFLAKGDKISLTTNKSNAKIYYTIDGSTPTANSRLYNGTIIFENDIKLRAVAIGDGYENSNILSHDYYLTNVRVEETYPNENVVLFNYNDVNPYISFSNRIEADKSINEITVIKDNKEKIKGEIIVADSTVFFIPDEPLESGCTYKVSVPDQAIVTYLGEPNSATSWTFCTGDYYKAISASYNTAAAIRTNGSLLTWGDIYKSGNTADGSYVNEERSVPETFIDSDVAKVSVGFMHSAVIKQDNSLWMWGRQYCGELGNNSTDGYANPIKIMENVKDVSCGVQSTAIVKNDNTLWMVGRNDFGQIGDGSLITRKAPVQIMSDVESACAGWCTSYAVKTDGTLYAWGRNDRGQVGDGTTENRLEPVKIMENVAFIAYASSETYTTAVVKKDGTLCIWGHDRSEPITIAEEVSCAMVVNDMIEYITTDGSLHRFSNGTSVNVATKSTDVVAYGTYSIILKKDGSVWSCTDELNEKLLDGRKYSELAGLQFRSSVINMNVETKNVIIQKPIAIDADYETLIWESDNEDVVSVSDRGVLYAHTKGKAYITATINDNNNNSYSTTCKVIVGDMENSIDYSTANNSPVKIWAKDNTLFISGIKTGESVCVYSTAGEIIDSFVADDNNITRPINTNGVIIVKIKDISTKVLNR